MVLSIFIYRIQICLKIPDILVGKFWFYDVLFDFEVILARSRLIHE